MSSFLIIVQIILISTYLFNYLIDNGDPNRKTKADLSKNITYILCVVNFIFLLMIHISLAFFSTDEIQIK
jgi:hypothetical protein